MERGGVLCLLYFGGTYQFQIPGVEVQDMDILGMQHEANACRVGNSVVPMFGVGRMQDDVCLSAISADSMDAYVSSLFSATMPIILSSLSLNREDIFCTQVASSP